MNTEQTAAPIPKDLAWQLCAELCAENRGKWWTFGGLMCWGCTTFTGGDPARRCLSSRPDFRGCVQVNARFDRLARQGHR